MRELPSVIGEKLRSAADIVSSFITGTSVAYIRTQRASEQYSSLLVLQQLQEGRWWNPEELDQRIEIGLTLGLSLGAVRIGYLYHLISFKLGEKWPNLQDPISNRTPQTDV